MSGKPATESAAMESEDSAERSVLGARRTCSHGTWPLAIRKPAESAWRPSAGTVLSMARKSQSIAEALCRVRRPKMQAGCAVSDTRVVLALPTMRDGVSMRLVGI